MKVLDFDKDTDEFAQFSVAFPKSWNEGTITYQVSGYKDKDRDERLFKGFAKG